MGRSYVRKNEELNDILEENNGEGKIGFESSGEYHVDNMVINGAVLHCLNVTISLTFSNCVINGLYVWHSDNVTIKDCTVKHHDDSKMHIKMNNNEVVKVVNTEFYNETEEERQALFVRSNTDKMIIRDVEMYGFHICIDCSNTTLSVKNSKFVDSDNILKLFDVDLEIENPQIENVDRIISRDSSIVSVKSVINCNRLMLEQL